MRVTFLLVHLHFRQEFTEARMKQLDLNLCHVPDEMMRLVMNSTWEDFVLGEYRHSTTSRIGG